MGSSDATASQIDLLRQALLVNYAVSTQLDAVGNNHGVPRPEDTQNDELYRGIIKALAWLPKQVLLSYYALLTAVFGTQEAVKAAIGRSWKVYEVNANEVIIEIPIALLSSPEISTYLHGASGFARVAAGPSNTFTTDFDLSLSSAVTIVGLHIYVETAPGTWTTYTVASYSFTAGVATVGVSASTLPTGGGRFYLEVPGDLVDSYRGKYLATSGFSSMYSTPAGPVTDTITVVGDATKDAVPGMTVLISINNVFQTRVISALSYLVSLGYSTSPTQMNLAVGFGQWNAGWLCDEASGNLVPAFGSPTLTASGTPTYGTAGPRGGIDKAVGLTAAADEFAGGAGDFDVGATDDLVVAFVGKWTSAPTIFGTLISKVTAAFGQGWAITGEDGTAYEFAAGAGGSQGSNIGANYLVGRWHVGIAAIDRAAGKIRFGIRALDDGTTFLGPSNTATGSFSNGALFTIGNNAWTSANHPFLLAATYVGKGPGVAAGIPTNLSQALANFAAQVNSSSINSTQVVLTTVDVPGGQVGQPLLLSQEVADTALTPPHSDRIYLTGTGLYQVVQFYLDLLVRTAGIVVRLEII